MFCRSCGTMIPDDSNFCPKCGIKVVVPKQDSPRPVVQRTSYARSHQNIQADKRAAQSHKIDGQLFREIAILVGGLVVVWIGYAMWVGSTLSRYFSTKTSAYQAEFGQSAPDTIQWMMGIGGFLINVAGAICLYIAVCALAQRFGAWRRQNKVVGTIFTVIICLVVLVCFSLKTSATGQFGFWDYLIMAAILGGMWKGGKQIGEQPKDGLVTSNIQDDSNTRKGQSKVANVSTDTQYMPNNKRLGGLLLVAFGAVSLGMFVSFQLLKNEHTVSFEPVQKSVSTNKVAKNATDQSRISSAELQGESTTKKIYPIERGVIDYSKLSPKEFDDLIMDVLGMENNPRLAQAITNAYARIYCIRQKYKNPDDTMPWGEVCAITQLQALLALADNNYALREALIKYGDAVDPEMINYVAKDVTPRYATDILLDYAEGCFSYECIEKAKTVSQGDPIKMYEYFSKVAQEIEREGLIMPRYKVQESLYTSLEIFASLSGMKTLAFLGEGHALHDGLNKYGRTTDPRLKGYRAENNYATDLLLEYAYESCMFDQKMIEDVKARSKGSPFLMFARFSIGAQKSLIKLNDKDNAQEIKRGIKLTL